MNILVVDDDQVLADVISFALRKEGFQVFLAHDGAMALQRWKDDAPDLIILDVNLPRMDGFTVCKRIRQEGDTPIILLTVRREEDDIVHGLELGADDYIQKPFSPRQLVARTKAVLRRAGLQPVGAMREVGELILDLHRREIRMANDPPIALTPLEARLMEHLMLHSGHVVPVEDLISYVWGPRGGDRDMLRQLIHRLRKKIESGPGYPVLIDTIPGIGYGLKERF